MIDLHIHTTASDGTLSPSDVVMLAKKQGFTSIAIADHDTVGGVPQAMRAGEEQGVQVLPCVELSVGKEHEIHLLGYGIDPQSGYIKAILEQMQRDRDDRIKAMVEKLAEAGFPIELSEVEKKASGSIGRPHIASVLIEKGVVGSVKDAFAKYIGKNAPYYVERRKISTRQAIETILNAGGVPVIAHPGQLLLSETHLLSWIDYMIGFGLRGLECYHSGHTRQWEVFLRRVCKERGLLVTGGSDFHGTVKPDIALGTGLANWRDAPQCLERLLDAMDKAGDGK